MSDKKQITISEVLGLLEQGKKRSEIATHFGITGADCKKLFAHPKLKGRKAHKAPIWELVDDVAMVEEPVVEAAEVADAGPETPVGEAVNEGEGWEDNQQL